MTHFNRRKFLASSAVLAAGAFMGTAFTNKKYQPLLSFSTLGCPDWTFEKIVDFAAAHQYKGLEMRGIQRELDLPKCAAFSTPENIAATMKLMKDKGLKFVDLGSSATLHFAEGAERQKNLQDGKRFIDLAQKINCPFVRVYPNNFQKDQEQQATLDLISSGLKELGEHAKGSGVTVLMETHGDLVKTDDLEALMLAVNHPQVGLIWDISNMWTITKQPPAEVYSKLKKYIHHTHIKDAKLVDGKPQYVFLGKGEVPIFEAMDLLAAANYKGFFSYEWEKLWHPELADPELALADYPLAMQQHFK